MKDHPTNVTGATPPLCVFLKISAGISIALYLAFALLVTLGMWKQLSHMAGLIWATVAMMLLPAVIQWLAADYLAEHIRLSRATLARLGQIQSNGGMDHANCPNPAKGLCYKVR